MEEISSVDGIHLVSGDGSIGILQLVDPGTRVHVHYLEPDRGLHEVVLHLDVRGRPKDRYSLLALHCHSQGSRIVAWLESTSIGIMSDFQQTHLTALPCSGQSTDSKLV